MQISVEKLRPVSRVGAELLKFINAVLDYCDVLKDVRHKREKVAKLEKLLAQVSKHSYFLVYVYLFYSFNEFSHGFKLRRTLNRTRHYNLQSYLQKH